MIRMDWASGLLQPSKEVHESVKTLGQLEGIFENTAALKAMDPRTAVYRVQAWCPVPPCPPAQGTTLEPGRRLSVGPWLSTPQRSRIFLPTDRASSHFHGLLCWVARD